MLWMQPTIGSLELEASCLQLRFFAYSCFGQLFKLQLELLHLQLELLLSNLELKLFCLQWGVVCVCVSELLYGL